MVFPALPWNTLTGNVLNWHWQRNPAVTCQISPRSELSLLSAAATAPDIFTIMAVCSLHYCAGLADELLIVRLAMAGYTRGDCMQGG